MASNLLWTANKRYTDMQMRSTLYSTTCILVSPTTPSSSQTGEQMPLSPFIMTLIHDHVKEVSQRAFAVPQKKKKSVSRKEVSQYHESRTLTLILTCNWTVRTRSYFLALTLKSQRKATLSLLPPSLPLSHQCLSFPGERTRKRPKHELAIVLKTVVF